MKHKLFILSACFCALLFVSCHHQYMYDSGEYAYNYYLVNKTSSPITLEWVNNHKNLYIAVNDTVELMLSSSEYHADDLQQLYRPSLEDGYEHWIQRGEWILTYQDKKYKIDDTQENSFTVCANYRGHESPKSVFIYEYYFDIDEEYIATLPLLE